MDRMKEKILNEGVVLPGGVLHVGSFLNQLIDTAFMAEIGKEVDRLFKDDKPTKLLTIEASGIGIAVAAGMTMGLPVLFVKKGPASNISGDVYTAKIHSFTHGVDNLATVSKKYLNPEDRILIIDDFLAHGCAFQGLIDITKDAGAYLVGCCAAIEKGFQHGGDKLREKGYRVESLVIIDEMTESGIVFR
jgi:xanthine phosphoribosyltransferase